MTPCYYTPDPSLASGSLTLPAYDERIVPSREMVARVAPLYNSANLPADSTQAERHKTFTAALRKLIDAGIFRPRTDGLRLVLVASAIGRTV